MSIFVTGDTHGEFGRFKRNYFPASARLTKGDYVIICGDFGGVWDGSPEERHWLDWLEAKPFTTLFISGNHENYDLLSTYPVESWQGGEIQRVRPSVIHLMRGQVFELEGSRFFTMGGASSHDAEGGILDPDDPLFRRKCRQLRLRGLHYRVRGKNWWPEELPSPEEYETARTNLEKSGWNVNYIVTHCAPISIQRKVAGENAPMDALNLFLEDVKTKCRFQQWFFGHYHDNLRLEPGFRLIYQDILFLN